MRPSSTDDERVVETRSIQAPDSETVVPETQLEYENDIGQETEHGLDSDFDLNVPLTPRSAALLDSCAVKKVIDKPEPPSFAIKLLTKPTLGDSDDITAPPITFSFGQAKRTNSKAAPAPIQPVSTSPKDPSPLQTDVTKVEKETNSRKLS